MDLGKGFVLCVCLGMSLALLFAGQVYAQEQTQRVYELGTVQIMEESNDKRVIFQPQSDIILVDEYVQPVIPQNVVDVIKDQPIIDFRGATDLVPDDDTIFMRGFSSKRFVTSVDGLTLRKTGGRRSSHIVDYGLIPAWMIEEIEILPGPHSALYPSKSIGGVLNLKTRTPKRYATLKPEGSAQASYRSYNTQNHNLNVRGGYNGLIYNLGGQTYSTNGYLRNNEADINTVHGRGGYVFTDGGHLTLSATYTDADRQVPVINDPNNPTSDYDSDYPVVELNKGYFDAQAPSWDKIAQAYNLDAMRPTPIGDVSLVASYSEENRDLASTKLDGSDQSWETKWRQWSAKAMNEFQLAQAHTTTVGLDLARLYDGYGRINRPGDGWYDDHERFRTWGAFAEHTWRITPRLELMAGLRYEYLKAFVDNYDSNGQVYITGRDEWIERDWDELIPKSFLTYELDDLAKWLRDTSLSVGVSRIWRAPGYHGDVNPQGRPAGAWLDPEQGMGYDLVLQRRLWGDIQVKTAFSYYQIEDFIASNRKFSEFWPNDENTNVPAGQEYKDYKINLDEVQRQGVELSLRGHLFDPLFVYLGYAYVDFENEGHEPAGEEEVANRAKHRFNAGLEYDLFQKTKVLLDYKYQDSQVAIVSDYLGNDTWSYEEVPIDSYHLFDLAVQQTLFTSWKGFKSGKVSLYMNNVFDEEYENVDAYPATDRTFGVALSVDF